MDSNSLYYGDNLDILRRYVEDESADLIYLDPPFNSNQTYNILFQEKDGTQSASQIKAFGDTWHWDETAARSYEETVEAGGQVAEALQAFRKLLGANDILGLHVDDGSPFGGASAGDEADRQPLPALRPHGESFPEASIGCDLGAYQLQE